MQNSRGDGNASHYFLQMKICTLSNSTLQFRKLLQFNRKQTNRKTSVKIIIDTVLIFDPLPLSWCRLVTSQFNGYPLHSTPREFFYRFKCFSHTQPAVIRWHHCRPFFWFHAASAENKTSFFSPRTNNFFQSLWYNSGKKRLWCVKSLDFPLSLDTQRAITDTFGPARGHFTVFFFHAVVLFSEV